MEHLGKKLCFMKLDIALMLQLKYQSKKINQEKQLARVQVVRLEVELVTKTHMHDKCFNKCTLGMKYLHLTMSLTAEVHSSNYLYYHLFNTKEGQ